MAQAATLTAGALPQPAAADADRIDPRRLLTFFFMVFGMFMAILDIQIVSASLTEIQELAMAAETDPNALSNAADVRAVLDLVEGRIARAGSSWREHARRDPFSAAGSLLDAAEAALWLRDPERAAEALAALDQTGTHGRFLDAVRISLGAGVAALEGRRAEAIAGYRSAVTTFRSLGVLFRVARTGLTAAIVLGADEPAIAELVEESRRTLSELGAIRLLERVDAIVATGPEAGSKPARTDAVGSTESRSAASR